MVKILTELKYIAHVSRNLGTTFKDMNDSKKQTEKPKQRELLNRGLQIPLHLPLASSNPCTNSIHLARI